MRESIGVDSDTCGCPCWFHSGWVGRWGRGARGKTGSADEWTMKGDGQDCVRVRWGDSKGFSRGLVGVVGVVAAVVDWTLL